jgi:hypothetical protein
MHLAHIELYNFYMKAAVVGMSCANDSSCASHRATSSCDGRTWKQGERRSSQRSPHVHHFAVSSVCEFMLLIFERVCLTSRMIVIQLGPSYSCKFECAKNTRTKMAAVRHSAGGAMLAPLSIVFWTAVHLFFLIYRMALSKLRGFFKSASELYMALSLVRNG